MFNSLVAMIVQSVISYFMRKKKIVLLVIVALALAISYCAHLKVKSTYFQKFSAHNVKEFGILDTSVSCKFPYLQPFDPATYGYVRMAPNLKCSDLNHYLLYVDDEGFLRYNKSSWSLLGLSVGSSILKCQYNEILRHLQSDIETEYEYGQTMPFIGKTKLSSDFVYVECMNLLGIPIYTNFFAHAQRKEEIKDYKDENQLDLIVIGLDSMSRLNFIRQLPKTYEYMKTKLHSVDLLGFNKVGLNTFPNVMAMLTGKPPPLPPHNFEEMSLLWDFFKEKGAATMYAEDRPDINMFVLHGKGIRKKPTDHYAFTFWQAVEKSFLNAMSNFGCLGQRMKHSIHFNYLKSFLRTYRNSPKFLFSLHNEITHDFLNLAGVMDDDMKDLLESSYNEGLFNRSVVVVLSDHGQRIDEFRTTEMGKIEDFMPFVSFILPQNASNSMINSWISSLKLNTNRLTGTYDLYKTFLDILSTLDNNLNALNNINKLKQIGRGLSLFGHIPKNRTCSSAGIPESYCVCTDLFKSTPQLSLLEPKSVIAAKMVIKYMNTKLSEQTELCSKMSLFDIKKSVYIELEDNKFRIDLSFTTAPNHGLFEAIIKIYPNRTFEIIGEIVRLNLYSGQSDCLPDNLITQEFFKTICYCKFGRGRKKVISKDLFLHIL